MLRRSAVLLALLPLCGVGRLAAQNSPPLTVGTTAPDFVLPAATEAGVSPQPIHLADLRDQTVVIAFFYQARTKG